MEELPRAVDLALLDLPEFHGGQRTLSFGDEVDVLNGAFQEGDGPIRAVVSDRSWDEERLRQFGVDRDISPGVELADEFAFSTGIREHVIENVTIGFEPFAEISPGPRASR